MDIPIYFNPAYFTPIFEDQNYFKDKTIKILHLGAYTGHGTKWMLERVSGSCIDVDLWKRPLEKDSSISDEYYSKFYNDTNVESLYDQTVAGLPTTKFKGTTKEFFEQNKETFDFIYIDASHKKSDVELDINESWKILNPGGVIGCDDYLWHIEDDPEQIPHYAIKNFIESHVGEIEILIDAFQLWFKKVSK
jgi:predicted O-methyltransferase YrrM